MKVVQVKQVFEACRKVLAAVIGAMVVLCTPAHAQAYPTRPVTIVVAYTPGGANDIVARIVAEKLSQELGQPFIVENRPGTSGIAGTAAVSHAPPDGHTLLLGAGGNMTINPGLFRNLPYESPAGFASVGLVARGPLVMLMSQNLPVRGVAELIAYGKEKKGGLTFASPGAGTTLHLAGELFGKAAGLELLHVPYKGSAPALADLMAGRVDLMFDVLSSSIQFVNAGKLRALAVTSAQRSRRLPQVPTLDEQGLQGFDVSVWFGLFAPAGTPDAVVTRLNAAITKAVSSSGIRERFAPLGLDPATSTPQQLRALADAERARWTKVIQDIKLQPN